MSSLDGPRGGVTFDEESDGPRLNKQARRVFDAMKNMEWHTLRQLSDLTGDPEASVSARLRDFRKTPHGGMTVERQHIVMGLWKYRLQDYGTLPASEIDGKES